MSAYRIVGSEVVPVQGQVLLGVHAAEQCDGRPCVIHRPSNHSMRHRPLLWRDDRGIFERLCPHGIGHPDPDQRDHWIAELGEDSAAAMAIHGCDGCCSRVPPCHGCSSPLCPDCRLDGAR